MSTIKCMNIHLHISQKAVEVGGAYHVECIITEAKLEEIEALNEFNVSYHFKEFQKALAKGTEKACPPTFTQIAEAKLNENLQP